MARFEVILLAFCAACGLVAAAGYAGLVTLAGWLELELYPLYIAAAATGWLAGNVFVHRSYRQGAPGALLLSVYLIGPLAPLVLLRAMAPPEEQERAPLVPLFACAVLVIFFLVPWSLRASAHPPRRLQLGGGEDEGE